MPTPEIADDGHLRIVRGAVVETYRNRDDGVEQSWEVASVPPGMGDLLVSVKPSGLAYVGTTDAGLHFADRSTGLGFRYGLAAWIDAAGVRTRIDVEYRRGTLQMTVPDALLERSSYPAVLDPIISPEAGIDEVVIGSAEGTQHLPSVAFNGATYLVVWEDRRADGDSGGGCDGFEPSYSASGADVYGARIATDGTVLDPIGIPIAKGPACQGSPSVASDGTDYVVAWEELQDGSSPDVRAARVSSAGSVIDTGGIAVATGILAERLPRVASTGTESLVVWMEQRDLAGACGNTGAWDVRGARVRLDGSVVPLGSAISPAGGCEAPPRLAASDDGYLVAWEEHRGSPFTDIYGARVDADGTIVDPAGIPISSATDTQTSPSVTWNGTDFFVVWIDHRNGTSEVYGARVGTGGVVVDPTGISIATSLDGQPSDPQASSDGVDYFVAWNRVSGAGSDVVGTRVTSGAVVSDPAGLAIAVMASSPALAFDGTGYLVAWVRGSDIYGTIVAQDGTIADPSGIPISRSANVQTLPSVASNGSDYLLVWEDARNGDDVDIFGSRVSADGTIVDPVGIAISTAVGEQRQPSLASNGTDYLVVWQDARSGDPVPWDVYGARVTSAGSVVDSLGVAISTAANAQSGPLAASDGTDYYVVWNDARDAASVVYGTRVTAGGIVVEPSGTAISSGSAFHRVTGLAGSTDRYLVAWADWYGDVHGARVTGAGVVEDPSGFVVSDMYQSFCARIASDGTDFTVVSTGSSDSGRAALRRVLVDADGNVSEPVEIAAYAQAACPTVAFNGFDYLVAWAEPGAVGADIHGTRLLDGSNPESTTPILLAGHDAPELAPALAAGASGRFLLAYQRFVEDPALGSTRVRTRLIEFNGSVLGAACTLDSECESAHCVDGVCCDSACGTNATDCMACSRAAGAPADGTCALLGPERVCRAAIAECDAEERCTGTSPVCPFDAVAGSSTVCRSASCIDGWVYGSTYCDGSATCPATPLPLPCGAYACGDTTCLTSCSSHSDCITSQHCVSGGECAPDLQLGQPCVASEACKSGHCVDGVCRESDAPTSSARNDAGPDPDAGTDVPDGLDASVNDASADASLGAEAGDASLDGTFTDASTEMGSVEVGSAGCGCRLTRARPLGSASWWTFVAAMALLSRRRDKRRPHGDDLGNSREV